MRQSKGAGSYEGKRGSESLDKHIHPLNEFGSNSLNEQSDPCQFRSQEHMSCGPHWPCPEQALGHSAATPKRFAPTSANTENFISTEKLPNASLLGKKSNEQIIEWLRTLDVFVLPCVRDKRGDMDGIPVSLMEAMVIGVPVISTNISGIPELITHNVTGFVAEPGDVKDLVQNISYIINLSDESK